MLEPKNMSLTCNMAKLAVLNKKFITEKPVPKNSKFL
jgi:hypothetical protein